MILTTCSYWGPIPHAPPIPWVLRQGVSSVSGGMAWLQIFDSTRKFRFRLRLVRLMKAAAQATLTTALRLPEAPGTQVAFYSDDCLTL